MKKFLEDLKNELQKNNFTKSEINEILMDHSEMIEEAVKEGLEESEIRSKFGEPAKLAKEIERSGKEESRSKEDEKGFIFEVTSEIIDIEARMINEDLEVFSDSEETISVTYTGKGKIEDYNVTFENNKLVVERKKLKGTFFGFDKDLDFKIVLPKSLKGDKFLFDAVNGDFLFRNLNAKNFVVKAVNGDLEIENVNSEKLSINLVNGDISLKKGSYHEADFQTVSGDFSGYSMFVDSTLYFETVSGDIKLEDSEAVSTKFQAVNGDFKGIEFYTKTISIGTVSGDVKIQNNDSSRPIEVLRKSTLSGSVHI